MSFKNFNFDEQLFEGLLSMGYKEPTPIQKEAIPVVQKGKDLIACAQTGTGKTASYLLPILDAITKTDKEHINTLILAPTRELAQQIDQQVEGLAYFTGISSVAVYGGGSGIVYEQQRSAIEQRVDIIIATPGRLIAHLTSGIVNLDDLQHLILDEADRMLDMGFYDDIMRIVSHLPKERQTLLFSATMPPKIRKLANSILKDPEQINIAISKPAEGIDQQIYRIYDEFKIPLIQHILKENDFNSVIIFASTKEKVKDLYRSLFKLGISVKAFHSDLEQDEREEILREFKSRKLRILIGTDVLSRGIDVEGIDLVVNFDVPSDPEDYVHRIGRTARAQTKGTAITLVNDRDQRKLDYIESLIGKPVPKSVLLPQFGTEPEAKAFDKKRNQGGGNNKNRNWKNRPKAK